MKERKGVTVKDNNADPKAMFTYEVEMYLATFRVLGEYENNELSECFPLQPGKLLSGWPEDDIKKKEPSPTRMSLEGTAKIIENALSESFLLHTRNLVEILLSNGHKDNIKLKDLPGCLEFEKHDWIKELDCLYGKNDSGTPRYALNKRFAHPTTIRGKMYNYQKVINEICPTINKILALPQISNIHGAQIPNFKETVISTSTFAKIDEMGNSGL